MAPCCVVNLELDPSGPAVHALPGAIFSGNAVAYRSRAGSKGKTKGDGMMEEGPICRSVAKRSNARRAASKR